MRNPEAESFFLARSARDEVGSALIHEVKTLGDYELRGNLRQYKSPYAVTAGLVFCGAAGMFDAFVRLSAADRTIALATGATPADDLGPEWVCITLFRHDWPKPDLNHWVRRAYDYARTGQ